MNKLRNFGFVMLAMLMIMACDNSSTSESSEEGKTVNLEGNDYLVTIKTDLGEMKAILYDQTPKHKENFIKLVKDGFYDSLLFHRVMQGFMIQGGDPDSKYAGPGQRLGVGGPGYTVPAEFISSLFHKKGALSAARQPTEVNPDRASSGSQFYIVQGQVLNDAELSQFAGPNYQAIGQAIQYLRTALPDHDLNREFQEAYDQGGDEAFEQKVLASVDRLEEATGRKLQSPPMSDEAKEAYQTIGGTPFLDQDYTIFGQVIEGIEVIDAIAAVQTAPGDRPVEDIRMYISIEEMPKKEISEKYGYDFSIQ